jgi:hypothetical protein
MHFFKNRKGEPLRGDGTVANFSLGSKGRSETQFIHMSPIHRSRMDAVIRRDGAGSQSNALTCFFECYWFLTGDGGEPEFLEKLQKARKGDAAERHYTSKELPCADDPHRQNGCAGKGRSKGVCFRVTPEFRDRLKGSLDKDGPVNRCDAFAWAFESYLFLIGEAPKPEWLERVQTTRKAARERGRQP